MTTAEILELVELAMVTAALASAPAVIAAMTVGIAIGVLQALTQIQEATLTFVPKIIAVMLAMSLMGAFIGASLQSFAEASYAGIAKAR